MYFCIFEKMTNNQGWFYVRTLAYIDLNCGVELYKLKREITHIEELFEAYCFDNQKYTYMLDIRDYDPGNTNILNKKDMEVE